MVAAHEKNGCKEQLDDNRDKACDSEAITDLRGRECETARFQWGVAEKNKEYVKGSVCETKTGPREAKGAYDGH